MFFTISSYSKLNIHHFYPTNPKSRNFLAQEGRVENHIFMTSNYLNMKRLFKGLFFGIENIHSARSIITIFLIFLLFVVLLGKTVGMSSILLWQFIVIIPIIFISFIIISGPLLKHSVEIRIFTLTVTILIGWILLEFILPMIYGVNLSDASINDIIIGHREDVNKGSYEWWSESTQIPTNKITNGLSSLPFYILGISPFIGFFYSYNQFLHTMDTQEYKGRRRLLFENRLD